MSKKKTFRRGNKVIWQIPKEKGEAREKFIKEEISIYGKGPFKVCRVFEVPKDAPPHIRGGVGHTQWIVVKTPQGEVRMSGALFRRVPMNQTAPAAPKSK